MSFSSLFDFEVHCSSMMRMTQVIHAFSLLASLSFVFLPPAASCSSNRCLRSASLLRLITFKGGAFPHCSSSSSLRTFARADSDTLSQSALPGSAPSLVNLAWKLSLRQNPYSIKCCISFSCGEVSSSWTDYYVKNHLLIYYLYLDFFMFW